MFERDWIINSHRGAFKKGLLENSIESYIEAYRQGCNVLESDLHITKDNQIVLIHNGTIDGIAKLAKSVPSPEQFHEVPVGPVKEHTLAFLKALKFENDMQILTLAEYLELLKKLKMGGQIELKEGGYEDLILSIIQDAQIDYENQLGPIVCSSFNTFAVLRLVKKAPHFQIPLYEYKKQKGLAFGCQGIPLGSFYGNWVLRQCGKKHIWGFMTFYKYLPIKRIAFAHEQGVRFCPRLPDKDDLVNAYIDAGVDGFETDNVPFIRQMIEKKGFKLWPLPQ